MSKQIVFLQRSARDYDEGDEDEAQRMATTLRNLFHNNEKSDSNSKALIQHLGITNTLSLISTTTPYLPANMVPYLGVITLRSTGGLGGEYIANCLVDENMPNKWLGFDDWWNEIIIDDKVHLFTRRDIIRNIADKDGGSHVDQRLNADYANLTKNNSPGWTHNDGLNEIPFANNVAYSVVRQIAAEVLLSFDWFLNIQSYTRRAEGSAFELALINEKRYLCEKSSDPLRNALVADSRVASRKAVKCYIDLVKFTNGSQMSRQIFC
ncbi:MAG: hypothetical protein Q8N36_00550 [bacterium]|nr:hypothetical protein [bacterium]